MGSSLACTSGRPREDRSPAPSPPTPVASEREPAPDPVVKAEPNAAPPIEGIRHWATDAASTAEILARAAAMGIEVERTVEVKSLPELIEALAPRTAILLAPGRHAFADSDLLAEPAARATLPQWSTLSQHYDGGEIHDLEDLVILGAGPGPSVILQPDAYAAALAFRNVRDLALHNLVVGHRPDRGWCRGGVIRIIEGTNVLITDSTLFGSGTEGLTLVTVDGLRLQDSVITDCSEALSTISSSRGIAYENVRMIGNGPDLLRGFSIFRSSVVLINSHIADYGTLDWTGDGDAYGMLFMVDRHDIGTWHVDAPRPVEPARTRSEVLIRNTSIANELVHREL